MKPIDKIRQKAHTLGGLKLHFTYEQSSNIDEMKRIAKLAFAHFGLTNTIDIKKKAHFGQPTTYKFLVDGSLVCEYKAYGQDGLMGHANVTMCIEDMLSYALIKMNPSDAEKIAPIFDCLTSEVTWNY